MTSGARSAGVRRSPPSGRAMDLLRVATRVEHARVEEAFDLPRVFRDLDEYAEILERFLALYRPLEARLTAAVAGVPGLELPARRKVPWLVEDLDVIRPAAWSPRVTCQVPAVIARAEGLGCLYVLEGATLGGSTIARELQARLSVGPDTGGRFFHGYGRWRGLRWREFGAVIERSVLAGVDVDEVVWAAKMTFGAFEDSLGRT